MLVRHWMTEQVLVARPDDNIAIVATLLAERGVRQLPVVSNGTLVGIITDRDIRSVVDASVPVRRVMSRDPVSTTPTTLVEEAAARLRTLKMNALPVVEAGALVGIVTRSDLLDALIELCHVFEPTTVLELECEEGGVPLQRLRHILARHHAAVRWLSAASAGAGRQIVVVRVQTPIGSVPERDLEEAGFRVLSVVIGGRSDRDEPLQSSHQNTAGPMSGSAGHAK